MARPASATRRTRLAHPRRESRNSPIVCLLDSTVTGACDRFAQQDALIARAAQCCAANSRYPRRGYGSSRASAAQSATVPPGANMKMAIAAALVLLTGCASTLPGTGDASAARIAALEQRLDRMEDVQRIERLFRAYGYYFDKGLWAETTTLFTDDARVEIAQRGVYQGRAGVERMYVNVFGRGHNCLPPRGLNNHLILQPIITVA